MGSRIGQSAWRAWLPYRLALMVACAVTIALPGCSSGGGDDGPPAAAVVTAPTVTTQPGAQTLTAGSAASFTVVATGTAPLAFQWQRDGSNIAGATSASYNIAAVGEADSGAVFRVVVTNTAGSATSNNAALTVNALVVAPTVSASSIELNALDGTSLSLNVTVDGSAPFTYVWKRNGVVIADATGRSYSTPLLTLADNGVVYTATVSNSAGSVDAQGRITVNPAPPIIGAAPASTSVPVGQSATFTASATGSSPLTYQWQRNGVAIAGATASSYTTPATTLADNGVRIRVVVANGGGSATSAEATLGVSSVIVAPAIVTAPQNQTVSAGQTATFTASASGTGPLAYQWLRNGTALPGATAASYTTAATAVAVDNGAAFSVRVSNAASSVVSAGAVLTVQPATSALIGRAWTAPQQLESNDGAVIARDLAIDDAGRTMVVFLKVDGGRNVLYATRGTPNASGAVPNWSTPVAIDLPGGSAVNNMTSSNYRFGTASAPNGNAVVYWFSSEACTASTYRTNSTSCRVLYTARFLQSSGNWEAPVRTASAPSEATTAVINNRGDIALSIPGWVRSGATSYASRKAIATRPVADAVFNVRTFTDAGLGESDFGMDEAGNLLFAAEASQNNTVDMLAWRGTVDGGFGAPQLLDTRGAAVTLRGLAVGRNGQQIVLWSQNNGTASVVYAAATSTTTAGFVVTDLGSLPLFGKSVLTIADSGDAMVVNRYYGWRVRWLTGVWEAKTSLPSNTPGSTFLECAHARNGNFLCVASDAFGEGDTGRWTTYDANLNLMIQTATTVSPSAGYVLGLNLINRSAGFGVPVLSVSGIGNLALFNEYDALPTPAAPAGDRRSVNNLWSTFLK